MMDIGRGHTGWRRWFHRRPRVSVVRLSGVIGLGGPLRSGLTLAGVADRLERAFRPRRLAAVALVINSPGGAPVQSALIAGRIRALADEKKVPVLAFVEDVAASGGYWLACAADEIFADQNSIVGSIGVISAGFGFHDLIARYGIERRVHAVGPRKTLLDPFKPETAEDIARLASLHEDMHAAFIDMVRCRRSARLKGPDTVLFSGEFWTGRRALALGLIDGLADVRSHLRARFGTSVRMQLIAEKPNWLARHVGLTATGGVAEAHETAGAMVDGALGTMVDSALGAMVDSALGAIEERAHWTRYGL